MTLVSPALVVLAAVVVMLAMVALLPRTEVRHPVLSLVRVLVPSWRFFDDLQVTPALLVRVARGDDPFGTWRPILSPPRRSLAHLAWNPEGNLLLAQQSLLERLVMDLAEWDENDARGAESLVSYQLVLNLVRSSIATDGTATGATRVQFKLVECEARDGRAGDDLMISREHTL